MVNFDLFHSAFQEDDGHREGTTARCCYFGGVGSRIDAELLSRVSQEHILRIVGAVRIPLAPLAPNAEILEPVPYTQLPELLKGSDVFLFPYRVNEFTKGILPAKIFECFATGRPVVSTYMPSLLPYDQLVYISQNHEEFLANIEKALDEPPELRSQRIAVAKENTADHWMDQLSKWISSSLD
jgi:glycosyltransferase involved in cell wall biosynthesis